MKLIRDRKGQIRVIESLFASILLFSSLSVIPAANEHVHNSYDKLCGTAQNLLETLDNDGQLAALITSTNWLDVKRCVQSVLPPTLWFNLTIFDENMTRINDTPICSGNSFSGNMVAFDYICATTNGNFDVYIVRLQLAMVE
ncbi:MAG: hypothetical protein QXU99_05765 [Candidatus Bathyarchaeia archaeon]